MALGSPCGGRWRAFGAEAPSSAAPLALHGWPRAGRLAEVSQTLQRYLAVRQSAVPACGLLAYSLAGFSDKLQAGG